MYHALLLVLTCINLKAYLEKIMPYFWYWPVFNLKTASSKAYLDKSCPTFSTGLC